MTEKRTSTGNFMLQLQLWLITETDQGDKVTGANTEKYFAVSHFKCTEPSMSWGVYGVQLAGRALTKNIWLKIGPNLVIKKIGLNLVIKTFHYFFMGTEILFNSKQPQDKSLHECNKQ